MHTFAGSVAAVKLPQLCQTLGQLGELKVVATQSARHFFSGPQLQGAQHGEGKAIYSPLTVSKGRTLFVSNIQTPP